MHEDATEALINFYKTNSEFKSSDFFHKWLIKKQEFNITEDKNEIEDRYLQNLLKIEDTKLSKELKNKYRNFEEKYVNMKTRILIKSSQSKMRKKRYSI